MGHWRVSAFLQTKWLQVSIKHPRDCSKRGTNMQPPQKKPSQALGGILGCDPMEGLLKECQLLSLGPGYF